MGEAPVNAEAQGGGVSASGGSCGPAQTLVSDHVTWKPLGNSLVLLNLADSTYYVLNETASSLFHGVQEGKSDRQIAEGLAEEFDCSVAQAFADVGEAREYLVNEGVLKAAG